MNKYFLLGGSIVTLTILCLIFFLQIQDTDKVSPTLSDLEITKDKEVSSAENVTNNNYVNDRYSFSLSIPESWEDYTVKVDEGSINILGIEPDILSFELKEGELQPRLDIWIFDKSGWEKLTTEYGFQEVQNGGPLPTKIAGNDRYIFSYSSVNILGVKSILDSFQSIR